MAGKESTVELDEPDYTQKSSKKKWIIGIVVVIVIVAVALLVAHFGFDAFGSSGKTEADSSTGGAAAPDHSSGPWPKLDTRTYGDIYGENIKAGPNAGAELQAECKKFIDDLDKLYVSFTTSTEQATIENFLYPYNDYQVQKMVFDGMASIFANAHPEESVRDAANECSNMLLEFNAKFDNDPNLYHKLQEVQPHVADGKADPITASFVHDNMEQMERTGIAADDVTKEKLRKLGQEIGALANEFQLNIAKGEKSIKVKADRLKGLPEDWLAARPADADGMVTIKTATPDYSPVMQFCEDKEVRRELYYAYQTRAYPENEAVLRNLLRKRREFAVLQGYEDWTQYATSDQMTGNDKVVREFIDRIVEISKPRAALDNQELVDVAKQMYKNDSYVVEPFEINLLADRVKREKYAFDSQVMRPYFNSPSVFSGALDFFSDMFGLRFELLPKPDPVVTIKDQWLSLINRYAIYDTTKGDKLVAHLNLDLHPRDGKYGHAAVFSWRSAASNPDAVVETSMVCNFPDPATSADGVALMSIRDTETYFHEFGHVLHNVYGGRNQGWEFYGALNNLEWDFVEAPSQVLEEWMPKIDFLHRFAKHHATGEPIPEDMVAQFNRSSGAGIGRDSMMQCVYADFSFSVHKADPETVNFEKLFAELYNKYMAPFKMLDGIHFYTAFGHLAGYSSNYYTYKWSEVISTDLFTKFEEEGVLNPDVFKKYRDTILVPSGTRPAADSVAEFLGRPYSFDSYSNAMAIPDLAETAPAEGA